MSDGPEKPDPGSPYTSPQADMDHEKGESTIPTEPDKEERQFAMFAHLSGILAALVTGTFAGFAGPLIIWIIKKDDSEFVGDQAKEALNFQITLLIIYLVCWAISGASCFFLSPILVVPFFLQLIFGIIAGMKANEGELYRYPFNIRMVT